VHFWDWLGAVEGGYLRGVVVKEEMTAAGTEFETGSFGGGVE